MKCTMFRSFILLLAVDAKGEPEAQICQDKIIILNEMKLYWDLQTATQM